jgi:hypothetical protein
MITTSKNNIKKLKKDVKEDESHKFERAWKISSLINNLEKRNMNACRTWNRC